MEQQSLLLPHFTPSTHGCCSEAEASGSASLPCYDREAACAARREGASQGARRRRLAAGHSCQGLAGGALLQQAQLQALQAPHKRRGWSAEAEERRERRGRLERRGPEALPAPAG